jgi:hypothetical protein
MAKCLSAKLDTALRDYAPGPTTISANGLIVNRRHAARERRTQIYLKTFGASA